MIFNRNKSVPVVYIPMSVSHFDLDKIKFNYSRFWLGDSVLMKGKSYFTNIHVCCYKGNGKFDIEKDIIRFSEKWAVKVSAYYEYGDDDFIWVEFKIGEERRIFCLKPTSRIYLTYRIFGTELYIIAWDHCEEISTPDKLYDFIGNERKERRMCERTIGDFLSGPREDLQFVCKDDMSAADIYVYMTLIGFEIACPSVDYMKFYTDDSNNPTIVKDHTCTLTAERLIDDHSSNMIYITSPHYTVIRFNQETKFDKIFVKTEKENNVLNVILSASPDNFIEPSIDQYEGEIDTKKLITLDLDCDADSHKYLKRNSVSIKSVKYKLISSDIRKIQFRKPGFMKYNISVDPYSNIDITTKRYSDHEVFLMANINGLPQTFMQRLDNRTTRVHIIVDRKKDTIRFTLDERV